MKTATVVLSVTAALVSIIQPCPAPALVIAGASIIAGGAAVGGTLLGGINGKRDSNPENCLADMAIENKAYLQVSADMETTTVYNLPASCMTELDTWNAHPDIEHLNSVYGTMKKVDDTTISIEKPPVVMAKHMKSMRFRI